MIMSFHASVRQRVRSLSRQLAELRRRRSRFEEMTLSRAKSGGDEDHWVLELAPRSTQPAAAACRCHSTNTPRARRYPLPPLYAYFAGGARVAVKPEPDIQQRTPPSSTISCPCWASQCGFRFRFTTQIHELNKTSQSQMYIRGCCGNASNGCAWYHHHGL